MSSQRKVVIVGAGFLGSYIAKALVADSRNRIVLVSRRPEALHSKLKSIGGQLLPPASIDITTPGATDELEAAFKDASAVVSLTGILNGSPSQFHAIQVDGAMRVSAAAKRAGVERVVNVSAIGANPDGETSYAKTKGLGELIFLKDHPSATIIRPSLIFGPGDSFFARFNQLASFLPFLPVFGGGKARFQPVYAGDVARAVEISCRGDPKAIEAVHGKTFEAGGPDVFTYREIMQLVLHYSGKSRIILSLPFWVGMIQGWVLEKLPTSILTVSRDQVKQLGKDNVAVDDSFEKLLQAFPPPGPSSAPFDSQNVLTSVHDILPSYISPQPVPQPGKRTHGRPSAADFEAVKRMTEKAAKK